MLCVLNSRQSGLEKKAEASAQSHKQVLSFLMPLPPPELQRAEIIDWWNAERVRIDIACREAFDASFERATSAAENLSFKEMMWPGADAHKQIEGRVQSDITMLSKRMTRSLQDTLEVSIAEVEGSNAYGGASLLEMGGLVASGAMAAGSVGLAVAAATATTTTAGFLFLAPVTVFSWPMFATFGVSALTVAMASPKAARWAQKTGKARFLTHIETRLRKAILDDEAGKKPRSTCAVLKAQIDKFAQARLDQI